MKKYIILETVTNRLGETPLKKGDLVFYDGPYDGKAIFVLKDGKSHQIYLDKLQEIE